MIYLNAAKGSIIIILATFTTMILNYLFNVLLGWFLPTDEYGIYGVSAATLMILTVFVMSGFPWAAAKFLSENIPYHEKIRAFKSAFAGNIIVAIVVSLIFLIYPIQLKSDIVLLIVLTTLISSVYASYNGALQGFFKFKEIALTQVLATVAKLFVGITLVYLGYGAFGAVFGLLAAPLVATTFMFIILKDFKFWKARGWVNLNVFSFAIPTFLGLLGITVIQNVDILSLKILTTSDRLAGYYQATLTVARIPFFIAGAIAMVIFPFVSKTKDYTYSNKTLKYFFLFIFPLSLMISVTPDSFIRLIFPEDYLAGSKALSIIAIGMGFLALIQILTNVFQAYGEPKFPAKVLLLSIIIQIFLLAILVPKFDLIGAAMSTTITTLLCLVILLQGYLRRCEISVNTTTIAKLLLSYVLALAIMKFTPHSTRFLILVGIIVVSVLYFAVLLTLRLIGKEDIELLINVLPEGRLKVVGLRFLNVLVKVGLLHA